MVSTGPAMASDVAAFSAAVERFCASPLRTAGDELAADMREVSRCVNLVQLRFSEMAAAFAATNEYDLQGSVSPIHWIRHNCHLSSAAAADRVAVGESIQAVAESVQAMAGGEIGFAHLALIAREAEAVAESGGSRQFDEAPLLAKARDYSIGRFRNFCHHYRHAYDPEGYAAAEAQAVEARSLTLSTGEGGLLWIRGVLDPEGGAMLRNALEPLAGRNGQGDQRKRDRRLADALVELAQHGQRTHIQVTTTFETLLRQAGAPAADLELSLPISARAVERLACDCNLTRILLGADSQVIDVGRSKRVISGPTRKALDVRDRGCRWPGCDRPATYTAGHHLVHWASGGSTDLSNLVLLCHRHHWMVHEGGWQLVKSGDGSLLAIAPQMDLFGHLARAPAVGAA